MPGYFRRDNLTVFSENHVDASRDQQSSEKLSKVVLVSALIIEGVATQSDDLASQGATTTQYRPVGEVELTSVGMRGIMVSRQGREHKFKKVNWRLNSSVIFTLG